MSLLQTRLRASQDAKIDAAARGIEFPAAQSIEGDDIATRLQRQLISAEKNDLETVPRHTVLRMLTEKQLDEPFSFKCSLGHGANYVQAMRQVMSRTRHRASKKKIPLQEFKVYELEIRSELDHDVVLLLRTRRLMEHEESVYDELMAQVAKQPLK